MSLVELMIGLTVVAILVMVAVPSFSTALQNRQIRNAANAIQGGLQAAKTEALRRNRNVNFVMGTGSAWQVICTTPDTNTTDGEVNCPESALQTFSAQDGVANAAIAMSEHVGSAGGTTASSPSFTGTLRFTPLGRVDASTLGAANVAVFSITNPTGGTCAAAGGEMRCLNIVVASTGQIRVCDPAVSSGDPRAC